MDRRAVEGQGVEDRRGVRRLPSVKGFNKTMSSSLGESNRCMMVRSSPKLFWNGVLDRIISFLVQSSVRTFQISLFGRPLLKFIQKGKLSYPGHHSKITLEDFVMPWLLPANDEAMDFFNTLTLGNLSLDPSAILDPSNPRRPWNPRPLDDPRTLEPRPYRTLEPSTLKPSTLDPLTTLDPLP